MAVPAKKSRLPIVLAVGLLGALLIGAGAVAAWYFWPARRPVDPAVEPAVSNKAAEHAFDKARAALDAGKTDEALAAAREAIAEDPIHVGALTLIGELELDAGRTAEAVAVLEEAVQAGPDDPQARLALAAGYARLDRPRDAFIQYRKAHALVPDHVEIRQRVEDLASAEPLALAQVCFRSDDFRGALLHSRRALGTPLETEAIRAAVAELQGIVPEAADRRYDEGAVAIPTSTGFSALKRHAVLWGELFVVSDPPEDAVPRDPDVQLAHLALRLAEAEPGVVAISIYEPTGGLDYVVRRLDVAWLRGSNPAPSVEQILDRIEFSEGVMELP